MSTVREQTEAQEQALLAAGAAKSDRSSGRTRSEEPCALRTAFQRDRDRVVHSSAFRRLKHKTQVFLSPEGDYYRTRLTHTLEVSQIARTVARALRLNEDLTEAIALAHDLGHTPFGHAGERALDLLAPFGFRHYEQGVRVVTLLEREGRGLNLSAEVIDGILCHTTGEQAATLEGRVVRLCDRIAYMNHDIDDAMEAGIISAKDIPKELTAVLGATKSNRINTMVTSLVENSRVDSPDIDKNAIRMEDTIAQACIALHGCLKNNIYLNPKAKSEEGKVQGFIRRLFEHFCNNPRALPPDYEAICADEGVQRAAVDYIAGMTDRYAVKVFNRLFVPHGFFEA